MWAADIYYQDSWQSRFSGVYLVFEVFQDAWHSNKENPSVYWHAILSCPLMASDYANWYRILISFRSRSGCWPFLGLFMNPRILRKCWWFPISLYRRASCFRAFQTKVAHCCFCLVCIKIGDSFSNPNPHIQGKNMNKNMAPKLPHLPCFEAFGVIFCPDFSSYACLVCGGRGSPTCFWKMPLLMCS